MAASRGLPGSARHIPFGDLGIDFTEVQKAFVDPGAMAERFIKETRRLAAQGAEVVLAACATVNAIIRMVSQHRPLFYFGTTGIVTTLIGLATGIWVYERHRQVNELATGIALISVMLIILGTLSLFTGITLHSIRSMLAVFLDSGEK